MKKLIALAMIAGFATAAFADEKMAAEPSCKIERCRKHRTECKDCKNCSNKASGKKA